MCLPVSLCVPLGPLNSVTKGHGQMKTGVNVSYSRSNT